MEPAAAPVWAEPPVPTPPVDLVPPRVKTEPSMRPEAMPALTPDAAAFKAPAPAAIRPDDVSHSDAGAFVRPEHDAAADHTAGGARARVGVRQPDARARTSAAEVAEQFVSASGRAASIVPALAVPVAELPAMEAPDNPIFRRR